MAPPARSAGFDPRNCRSEATTRRPADDANDVLSSRVPVAITNGVVSRIAAVNDAVTHMIGVFI